MEVRGDIAYLREAGGRYGIPCGYPAGNYHAVVMVGGYAIPSKMLFGAVRDIARNDNIKSVMLYTVRADDLKAALRKFNNKVGMGYGNTANRRASLDRIRSEVENEESLRMSAKAVESGEPINLLADRSMLSMGIGEYAILPIEFLKLMWFLSKGGRRGWEYGNPPPNVVIGITMRMESASNPLFAGFLSELYRDFKRDTRETLQKEAEDRRRGK